MRSVVRLSRIYAYDVVHHCHEMMLKRNADGPQVRGELGVPKKEAMRVFWYPSREGVEAALEASLG